MSENPVTTKAANINPTQKKILLQYRGEGFGRIITGYVLLDLVAFFQELATIFVLKNSKTKFLYYN